MDLSLLVKPDFVRPNGLKCLHEEEAISEIKKIVEAFAPKLAIELGTKHGGFTSVLEECTPSTTKIYSFDAANSGTVPDRTKFGSRVVFVQAELLSSAYEEVTALLGKKVKKLLYCDNGKKIKELELYANHLVKGDLLGVHDWGIELSEKDVVETLSGFEKHKWDKFESGGLTTRFWIKKS